MEIGNIFNNVNYANLTGDHSDQTQARLLEKIFQQIHHQSKISVNLLSKIISSFTQNTVLRFVVTNGNVRLEKGTGTPIFRQIEIKF